MGDNATGTTFLIGVIVFGALLALYYVIPLFRMYSFFNNYVGYYHAHHILDYRKVKKLYRRLNSIKKTINGESIFDLALVTYTHRVSDEDLHEKTMAMLHALDSRYYKNVDKRYNYNESDVQRYCFMVAGISNRPDMIRFLLWLIMINPISVRKLKDLG